MKSSWRDHLPFDVDLSRYEQQARDLLDAWNAGDSAATDLFHNKHPRFLDEEIKWLPKFMSDEEIRKATLDLDDARLAVARFYDFLDWAALTKYVAAVTVIGSDVHRFEAAVEAVIDGDLAGLTALLDRDPSLVRARSIRVTHFDPPVHGATLLHYLGANGVEGYRQRSPRNAVDIARFLLQRGADADATAGLYGGQHATLPLLVSSTPPAEAKVQVALLEALIDAGASVKGAGEGKWTSPLMTALAFGFKDAAEVLARRGSPVDTVAAAAGLGRIERVRELLPNADALDRHRALVLAAQQGHEEVVGLLLEAGEDPNRYNPDGNHSHSTPMHQAALAGHLGVVRLLTERGARTDIKDTIYHGTPLEWAIHGGRTEVADYLRSRQG